MLNKILCGCLPTFFFSLLLAMLAAGTVNVALAKGAAVPALPYRLLATEPHRSDSFTQGWVKEGRVFYESSGLYKRSYVQRYDDASVYTKPLADEYFAEGLTVFNNTLYLLTWKANTLLLLDKHTLEIIQRLHYQGEGWGLTHNQEHLIMSNGTANLFFRDPADFSIHRQITVNSIKKSRSFRWNELEYVDGIIWANNWYDDNLYAINSHNGCLLAQVDLHQLRTQAVTPDQANILNGIAYDTERNAFWITGKYWPVRYLIRIAPVPVTSFHHCTQRGE